MTRFTEALESLVYAFAFGALCLAALLDAPLILITGHKVILR
jgi:hypothetical protein